MEKESDLCTPRGSQGKDDHTAGTSTCVEGILYTRGRGSTRERFSPTMQRLKRTSASTARGL